ncbi:iron-containing alcohol dehydrogenase [Erwinia endophytica]|uniref:iron-containing alcohol dehydrogenase n=1 Tax=Erwinia endophytica TaxID=1563158 RepID=UPI001265FC4F|nr:iron-containing alcohol dehydrogenase [Erwinia endophytica]KAB8310098.1 iron-containing alcohol dehydrogenase [Erwinia endophytica]
MMRITAAINTTPIINDRDVRQSGQTASLTGNTHVSQEPINVVSLANVSKNSGHRIILNNINLKLKKGEFVALPGASGFGKMTCAAGSPSSVLYNEQGARIGLINGARALVCVLVDSRIIVQSPPRFLQAGIVDALAKWYEFSPYLPLANGALGLLVKTQAAKLSLESILNQGRQAVEDNRQQRVTMALQNTIDAAICIAGLANGVKDATPRAGIAHLIHDSMTYHPQFPPGLHGEKVGFALVVQAILQDPDLEKHQELLSLLRQRRELIRTKISCH